LKHKFLLPCDAKKGQALVEFSLMLPIVLVMVFGLIFISFLFYSYMTLQSAVRDAAHTIVTDGANQTPDSITAIVQQNSFTSNSVNVVVSPSICANMTNYPSNCQTNENQWTIPRIEITVDAYYTVPFAQFTIPLPGNAPVKLGPVTIHAQSNMWTK
jgi:Flp pilus assembly protein TadG